MNERLILMTKRLLLSCVMISTSHAEWEALPPLTEPNGGFMCGVANGKIVVVGGTNWEGGKKNWLKAVRMFDPQSRQWSALADRSVQRAYGISFQYDHEFRFLGGSNGQHTTRYLEEFDGMRFSQTKDFDLPLSLVLSSGALVGNRLLIVGGTDDAANISGVTRTAYSIYSDKVTRMTDYPGKAFAVAASAVVGEELFVFGGMNYDADAKVPVNSTDAYAFSPEKNEWRKLKPLSTPNRGLTAVTLDERHIYIAGGYTDDFTSDAMIYDVMSDNYRKAKSLPYMAMVGIVKHEGFVYCLGGEDKKQSRTDKCFRIPVAELLK